MDVGVRELKAKLSQYLSRVADGEEVVVTERGKPIARLVPFADTTLQRGFDEGWIEAPRRDRLASVERVSASQSVMSVVDEDRG